MNTKVCTLLFLRRNDEILLAMKKRGFGSNRYNGIGGKVDKDETIEQALVRECQEEIEVTPLNYWKVAKHDFVQPEGGRPWRMIVHVFLCDTWKGKPVETEEMAPEWFKLNAIPYKKMWEDDEFWIPQVLARQKVHGSFTFNENEQLLTHTVSAVQKVALN